jgi:DNA-binding transcriptional ArsR family regulator
MILFCAMKAAPDLDDVDPELLELLRAYTALDNAIRLRAYLLIRDGGEIPFHEIAKAMGVESGLLAYHLAVLKVANIIEMRYERVGREISRYRLSKRGEELYSALFPRRTKAPRGARKTALHIAAR